MAERYEHRVDTQEPQPLSPAVAEFLAATLAPFYAETLPPQPEQADGPYHRPEEWPGEGDPPAWFLAPPGV